MSLLPLLSLPTDVAVKKGAVVVDSVPTAWDAIASRCDVYVPPLCLPDVSYMRNVGVDLHFPSDCGGKAVYYVFFC